MKKLIVLTMIVTSILAINPIATHAEWKQDSNGWWNSEANSWSVGWKEIDGKWYCFDNNGYMKTGWLLDEGKWYYLNDDGCMVKNTTIEGYSLGSDGAWIQTTQNSSNSSSNVGNSYTELNKLPSKYNANDALKDGDVVKVSGIQYNIGKLDKFIENYQNKKANVGDMVRITSYGEEGGAEIFDLINNSDGIKLAVDNTRDTYSSDKDRIITEYKIVDIYKKNASGCINYYVKTDQGTEKFLYSIVSK